MIDKPLDTLEKYPVRKSRKQKRAFREAVQAYLQSLGYQVHIEKGSLGVRNVVVGDPASAQYLVTAHYDTCAWLPFPNLITPCNLFWYLLYQLLIIAGISAVAFAAGLGVGLLFQEAAVAGHVVYFVYWLLLILMLVGPANPHNANDNTSGVVTVLEIAKSLPEQYRDNVCFVLFDLEEAGLLGSSEYRQKHKKEAKRQTVLNLDCVGDGDTLMLFPTGKLRRDPARMDALRGLCGCFGKKTMVLREKGISMYPSDQSNFPYGVGVAALHRNKWAGLYLGRIHTHRDTVLEEENVELLRTALLKYLTSQINHE